MASICFSAKVPSAVVSWHFIKFFHNLICFVISPMDLKDWA
jgi:hypothetical protein